ncbi:hypothetical protein [Pseudodesulfovibrio piezophilus]|uniref:Uncharacterized protein n=1 Tax=Pseudodesulfovibrio piezophilus (strain DSM 21447 / JCM 15486 / C1TLV30) TaxID=1322246 RepID=M1WS74_PSEP2|nr:hypothetical protein [Pseudodesulfovibrio piezophilus]CCH50014.1 protein of unknown function [Pseudodesulfovibrio piezophilus C1TLV30]
MSDGIQYEYRVFQQDKPFVFVSGQLETWKDNGYLAVELLDREGVWYALRWLKTPRGIDGKPSDDPEGLEL